ncbi:MAG: hypothetical protein QM673_17150 [Gordonia sp. (in: high G+C Gram-positive bacteria)]
MADTTPDFSQIDFDIVDDEFTPTQEAEYAAMTEKILPQVRRSTIAPPSRGLVSAR